MSREVGGLGDSEEKIKIGGKDCVLSSETYNSYIKDIVKSVPCFTDLGNSESGVTDLIGVLSQLDSVDSIYYSGAEDSLIFSDHMFISSVAYETAEERLKNLGNSQDDIKSITESVDTVIDSLEVGSKEGGSVDSVDSVGGENGVTGMSGGSNTKVLDMIFGLFSSVTPNSFYAEPQNIVLPEDTINSDYDSEDSEGFEMGESIEISDDTYVDDDPDDDSDELGYGGMETLSGDYVDDDSDEDLNDTYIVDSGSEKFEVSSSSYVDDSDEDEESEVEEFESPSSAYVDDDPDDSDDEISSQDIDSVIEGLGVSSNAYVDDDEDEESEVEELNIARFEISSNDYVDDDEDEELESESLNNSVEPAYTNNGVQNGFIANYAEDEEGSEYFDDDEDESNGDISTGVSNQGYFDDDEDEESVPNEDVTPDIKGYSTYFPDDYDEDDEESSGFVSASVVGEEVEEIQDSTDLQPSESEYYDDDAEDEDISAILERSGQSDYVDDDEDEDEDSSPLSYIDSSSSDYVDDDEDDISLDNIGFQNQDYVDDDEDEDSSSFAYVDNASNSDYVDDDDDFSSDQIGGQNQGYVDDDSESIIPDFGTQNSYFDDSDDAEDDDSESIIPDFGTQNSYFDDSDDDEDDSDFPAGYGASSQGYVDDDESIDISEEFSGSSERFSDDSSNTVVDGVKRNGQHENNGNLNLLSNVGGETSDDKLANSITKLAEGVLKLPQKLKKGFRAAQDFMRVDDDDLSQK